MFFISYFIVNNEFKISKSLNTDNAIEKHKHKSNFTIAGNAYPLSNNEVSVKENTEIGEALKELNNDDLSSETRMSGIDMRSRLHYLELAGILQFDSLIMFRFLPKSALPFTRQKKRLAVSLNGLGRQEIKDIVSGKLERDKQMSGGSLGDKIKGIFSPNNNGGQ